jgi:cytochrome c oxidase subunit II
MSRVTIAAGAAENTPEKLRLWIQSPDAIVPGSLMPTMKLPCGPGPARALYEMLY